MAETNITTENEQIELRELRRNSSKQIVSYTLEEDSDKKYGFVRVPGVRLDYDTAIYNRTMDGITNELINPIPNDPPEIIEQKFTSLDKLYYVQNNQLIPFNSSADEEEEEVDEFSGRYELTPNAISFRGRGEDGKEIETQYRVGNSHFSGISYNNNDVVNATDGFITFPGHREISWDNKVFGPDLQQFGYRVTKELIESGRNLTIRGIVGFRAEANGNDVAARSAIRRKRPSDFDNPVTRVANAGQVYLGSDTPSYPIQLSEITVVNSELVENDLYQILTNVGTRSDGTCILGDKCLFEVIASLPDDPVIVVPPPPPNTGPINNGATNVDNDVAEDAAQTSAG